MFLKPDLIMAIYYRQADTFSRAMADELRKDEIEIRARVCAGVHAHNKVPECSVYIIVFEMVMHEPVNQLAADKRAGPRPDRTRSCTRTCTYQHTITPPPPQPAQSNIFYYILLTNGLTSLLLLSLYFQSQLFVFFPLCVGSSTKLDPQIYFLQSGNLIF